MGLQGLPVFASVWADRAGKLRLFVTFILLVSSQMTFVDIGFPAGRAEVSLRT